jgi:hypothetical protein
VPALEFNCQAGDRCAREALFACSAGLTAPLPTFRSVALVR